MQPWCQQVKWVCNYLFHFLLCSSTLTSSCLRDWPCKDIEDGFFRRKNWESQNHHQCLQTSITSTSLQGVCQCFENRWRKLHRSLGWILMVHGLYPWDAEFPIQIRAARGIPPSSSFSISGSLPWAKWNTSWRRSFRGRAFVEILLSGSSRACWRRSLEARCKRDANSAHWLEAASKAIAVSKISCSRSRISEVALGMSQFAGGNVHTKNVVCIEGERIPDISNVTLHVFWHSNLEGPPSNNTCGDGSWTTPERRSHE